nr:hypothetical protein CFP56_62774 [Quercus suber]
MKEGGVRGGAYAAVEVADEDDQMSVRGGVLDEGTEGEGVAGGVEEGQVEGFGEEIVGGQSVAVAFDLLLTSTSTTITRGKHHGGSAASHHGDSEKQQGQGGTGTGTGTFFRRKTMEERTGPGSGWRDSRNLLASDGGDNKCRIKQEQHPSIIIHICILRLASLPRHQAKGPREARVRSQVEIRVPVGPSSSADFTSACIRSPSHPHPIGILVGIRHIRYDDRT